MIAYDIRLKAAAETYGLTVVSPSLRDRLRDQGGSLGRAQIQHIEWPCARDRALDQLRQPVRCGEVRRHDLMCWGRRGDPSAVVLPERAELAAAVGMRGAAGGAARSGPDRGQAGWLLAREGVVVPGRQWGEARSALFLTRARSVVDIM